MLPSHVRDGASRTKTSWALIGMRNPIDDFREKKVLVMGLGLHGGGVDMVKWLVQQQAHVVVTDLQTKKRLRSSLQKLRGLPVRYVLGRHRLQDIDRAQLIVASPGVPRDSKYLKYAAMRSIPVENDAAIFFERCPAPVIGITGTKGKTTTTMLTLAMLKKSNSDVVGVGYNEVPMMNALNRITSTTAVVAELSSWRLERLVQHQRSPHIAVCTNVLPDHLDRYRSFNEYAKAKKIIFDYQRPTDFAILNRDNSITRNIGRAVHGARWWFSLFPFERENGAFVRNRRIIMRSCGKETTICALPDALRRAPHQTANALAATLAARLSGASLKAIRYVIHHAPKIPHRLEFVRRLHGVRYINDSAATTPDAATAALTSIKGPIVLITGGTDKQLRFGAYARLIRSRCKSLVFLDGTATKKIIRSLPALSKTPVVRTMRHAVAIARTCASRGDTILLSPGAASFELFKHEFDRGDQFRSIVTSFFP